MATRRRQNWKAPLTLCLLVSLQVCSSLTQPPSKSLVNRQILSNYWIHWEQLLIEEYQETADQLKEQRRRWSQKRLEQSGLSIFGAYAEPDSDILGDKIVRVVKKGERYLRDRFSKGDVLLLTPLMPEIDPIPRECLVTDVGKDWLTVGVGPSWPKGLYECRKLVGAYQVRMDRGAPQAPLKFQQRALEQLRKGEAGNVAYLMASLFAGEKDATDLAAECPSRLQVNLDLEETIHDVIEEATESISFTPNQSQKDAITSALQRRISLIRGPPGTGKTRTAALLVKTALKLQQKLNEDNPTTHSKARVLAVTHSNGAADVLLQALLEIGVPAVRLGRPAAVSADVRHRTVVAISEKMPDVMELRQTSADANLDGQTRSAAAYEMKQCLADVQQMIMESAPVIVTSCIGAHQFYNASDSEVKFPIVVLDEAAQTTEPALVCALAASKAEQLVLVGDTRQLPPTVTSVKLQKTLGVSPMARLERAGIHEATLSSCYRMPPALLEYPSSYFYKGRVTAADELSCIDTSPPAGFPWPNEQPVAFIQVGDGEAEVAHNFGGKSNPTEAKLIIRIVQDLLEAGTVHEDRIAVISPYSKQVQLIRSELTSSFTATAASKKLQNVRVGTVDSFQGQEKDVIVYSAVRSNPLKELGFLRDARRLCVAITRARRGLILVGDNTTLRSCRHWGAFLESCQNRGSMMIASDLLPAREQERASVDLEDVFDSLLVGDIDENYGLF
ncbi:unnamed protein product [Cylindrotheca closterium]|uniref:RNA helicase n=1 Tax=Cylindrotheca closterium TaxID=2856 RepID=A0AAD2FF56_9STRA|nr:unnamed protein product [Cylindrotheca closterium]